MQFDYLNCTCKDLEITNKIGPKGKVSIETVKLNGECVLPTKRFMKSFKQRFRVDTKMTKLFTWEEIFTRIPQVYASDQFRVTIERNGDGPGRLLGATNITAPLLKYDQLCEVLEQHNPVGKVQYSEGIVRSPHTPSVPFKFNVGGDNFASQYVIDSPIDGYGKPEIYLSMLREICSNGMVAEAPAFRSEISLGKGETDVSPSLVRALESYNNEDGYLAIKQRIETSQKSWASVYEALKLQDIIKKVYGSGQLKQNIYKIGVNEDTHPLQKFGSLMGDINEKYGLTTLEAVTKKTQRKLPIKVTVYDLLNFATELATYDATASGNRILQGYCGGLLAGEYDLENTATEGRDYKDLWLHDKAVNEAQISVSA